ncbi:hypothetical protein, partial [Proteiniclasticum sp.]|uniref:hypothetical protein n=1 Tax=Proteiniclasticum sp. TaxID=2053595 RepID=UPI00289B9AAE
NGYGAYHDHYANDVGVSAVSGNNLYIENNYAIKNTNAELISVNDKFVNNSNLDTNQTPVTYY